MIKLSNGVELSEDTVVSALKKSGIKVEPEHIFRHGEIVENRYGDKRILVRVNGKLQSIDKNGYCMGDEQNGIDQKHCQDYGYKCIGKLKDMIGSN